MEEKREKKKRGNEEGDRKKAIKGKRWRRRASLSRSTSTSTFFFRLSLSFSHRRFSSKRPNQNHHQQIGDVKVGSEHPVRLQTMTTTGELLGERFFLEKRFLE